MRCADLEGQEDPGDDENDPWKNYGIESIEFGNQPFDLREEHERHPQTINHINKMRCTTWTSSEVSEQIYGALWVHPEGDASKGECRGNRHFQGNLRSDCCAELSKCLLTFGSSCTLDRSIEYASRVSKARIACTLINPLCRLIRSNLKLTYVHSQWQVDINRKLHFDGQENI